LRPVNGRFAAESANRRDAYGEGIYPIDDVQLMGYTAIGTGSS